jgi:hypothetical protein
MTFHPSGGQTGATTLSGTSTTNPPTSTATTNVRVFLNRNNNTTATVTAVSAIAPPQPSGQPTAAPGTAEACRPTRTSQLTAGPAT